MHRDIGMTSFSYCKYHTHKSNKASETSRCVCTVCVCVRERVHCPLVVNNYFLERVPPLLMGEGNSSGFSVRVFACVCVLPTHFSRE